ncbi:MAG: hypothetical protein ABEJ42_10415 [Halobacteriaceae archaeon]
MPDRGQVSLSLVEAAVGVLLVLAVTGGFAVAGPASAGDTPRLERYASDVGATLRVGSGDGRPPPVARAIADEPTFEETRAALDRRVRRLLPAGVLYRVSTPHGAVGYPVPDRGPVGRAVVPTRHGDVVVEVWRG